MDSSSSSPSPSPSPSPSFSFSSERKRRSGCIHEVFISFRGRDTRTNFISHLFAALDRKQIRAFIDSEDLRAGHKISNSLVKAIKISKLYLVIFSPNYGSSKWCLLELEKILQCSKQNGRLVIPVFYKVDPSHVRHQSGSFGDAFACNHGAEKVQSWRTTLKEASGKSGFHLNEHKLESEFIDEIVEAIWKRLTQIPVSTPSPVVFDVTPHLMKVMSLLCMDSPEVRSVGIWGPAGVGKTYIAELVFGCIRGQFDGYYFFEDVRGEIELFGKVAFWNRVVSEIIDEKYSTTLSLRLRFARQRLVQKRVLIVLDDVSDSILPYGHDFVEHHDLFALGSKILMTSSDKHVLKRLWVDEVYEVVGLKNEEALKFFSLKAFKKESPPLGYEEFSIRVVEYARGNPSALGFLATELGDRDEAYWNSALDKINKFPEESILDKLGISFDGLSGEERNRILGIALFCKGDQRSWEHECKKNIWFLLLFVFMAFFLPILFP